MLRIDGPLYGIFNFFYTWIRRIKNDSSELFPFLVEMVMYPIFFLFKITTSKFFILLVLTYFSYVSFFTKDVVEENSSFVAPIQMVETEE